MKRTVPRCLASAVVMVVAFTALSQTETEVLGTIEFPTSGSPEAHKHFLRGVKLLHSFAFEAAEEAFQEASGIEPEFAMAYWGEAFSHNHPLIAGRDLEAPRNALKRLAPTRAERLAKAPTEREKGFLEAVEILFGEGNDSQRAVAYSKAMRRLAAKYPDDHEVQAFYSVSLLATWYRVGGPDLRLRMKAGAIAQKIFRENPDHPGAAHYIIHSFDDPVHAALALSAAERYAEIAPDAAHALHMPSHIFIQHGMWEQVVKANDASYESASRLWQHRDGLSETEHFYNDAYVWHALDWGQYGDLQRGNYEKAKKAIDLLRPVAEETTMPGVKNGVGEMTARYIIETERWQKLPIRVDTTAEELLATGISAVRSGDITTAKKAEAKLKALYKRKKASESKDRTGSLATTSAKSLAVMHQEVAALVRLAKGQSDEAVELMKEAAAIAEDMGLPAGAANPLKPAHELYGEILLELDRPEEATAQFEASLLRTPNRTLSLRGLARAAAKKGDLTTARETYQKLMEVLSSYRGLPSYQEAEGFVTDSE